MMRISDTERREVARKLREIEELNNINAATDRELLDAIAYVIGMGSYGGVWCSALLNKLADLIDRPTCRNAADPYDGSFFECPRCGERWELICGSPADNNLGFCPGCGAEVVS